LEHQDALQQTAPELASRVTAEGMKLYTLQPESRNLETIFGEISAQEGRPS
jgi:ABC-2 type transport system ATP-binding protein